MSEAHYLRALCLREKGYVREAVDALRAAVSEAPGLLPAREELVDIYRAIGRQRDELDQLQALVALDRQHPERQVALGTAYARAAREARDAAVQDRYSNLAVITLSGALEQTPDHPVVFGALGEVWLDVATARADAVALRKAIEALRRAASSSSATSEAFLLYGRALALDNQLEASLGALREATERFPIDPAAFVDYAAVAERTNQLVVAQQALIAHAALVGDAPDSTVRAGRIGLLSLQIDETATAITWLQRALIGAPTDLQYLTGLAEAQVREQRGDEARVTITRGLALAPRSPQLLALARKLNGNS
jgi:tetratricopeptide (TPR) repeat protein